jgi:hypothetical protein
LKSLSKRWNRSHNLSLLPWLLMMALPGLAPVPGLAAESAQEEAERLRAERRAQAHDLDFFALYYTIEDERDTVLFLMNTITDPISVSIAARSSARSELALGTYLIEPLQHVEISLRERLAGLEEGYRHGSLRLSLLGDVDTLQGWTVVTGAGGNAFEIPLVTPEEIAARDFLAFWDATVPGLPGPPGVVVTLLNTSQQVLSVGATTGGPAGTRSHVFRLGPGQSLQIDGVGDRRFSPRGWLRLDHDGNPGDLLAVGTLGSRPPVAAIPFVPAETIRAYDRHESMPIAATPGDRGAISPNARPWVTLFNAGAERQQATVEALSAETGVLLGQAALDLEPGEVRSIPLAQAVPAPAVSPQPMRVRVRSDAPPLLVRGFTALPGGAVADLAFFPFTTAHFNGTYPLPDPARYETTTTVVNLGDEDSRIVAQAYWNGGTYALPPLTVPARGILRIDLEDLAETAPPDVLGRELDQEHPAGVLKWMVQNGSNALIGRTEARPKGGSDRFGFNCFGCCWELPRAAILPSTVEFTPGQSRSFEACVTYDTCSGTMGPFPANLISTSVAAPFVWNGSTITSSQAADGDAGFEAEELETRPNCLEIMLRIFGFGKAKMCQKTFNPNSYTTTKLCRDQTGNCMECEQCCQDIAAELRCKGKEESYVTSFLSGCLGDCIGYYIGNGC